METNQQRFGLTHLSLLDHAFSEEPELYFEIANDGQIFELNAAKFRIFSKEIEHIIEYGLALLRSDFRSIRFVVPSERGTWLASYIRVERAFGDLGKALVEIREVTPPFNLTLRELDHLTLIAAGFGNDSIAAQLGISPRTVAKHIQNIFEKTHIWSRAGLAGAAVDHGLLRLPIPGEGSCFPLAVGQVDALSRNPHLRVYSRRAASQPTIRIGMPLAQNCRGAADAAEMFAGAKLAVDEINSRGGVLNRQLEILPEVFDFSSDGSIELALQNLINRDVAAITMGYSSQSDKVMRTVSEYKAPFLHASTMEQMVSCVRDDPSSFGNIFQVCPSDVKYGLGLASFLNSIIRSGRWRPRNRTIAVVQPPWRGQDIGLSQLDDNLGGAWDVQVITGGEIGKDWGALIDRLHLIDPSVIVFASYFVEDSIAFQKAFICRPLPALVYKLYSPSIPLYQLALEEHANGVVWATTTGSYHDTIAGSFAREYSTAFGRSPGQSHAGIAYDRINILAAAWSRAGTFFKFDKVVADLRSSIHRGVNGAYHFAGKGQLGLSFPYDTMDQSISQAHLVFQIQDSKQRIISPSPYAEAVFRQPPWFNLKA